MKKERASEILGIREKSLKHFSVIDPFNGFNLEGYLSVSEQLYGSMVIFKIDNYLTEQIVIGTPKQKYPFNKLGKFSFPEAKYINVYEKYDGTNILSYGYRLGDKLYITFKTRLNPILGSTPWGNFHDMWKEVLETFPEITELSEIHAKKGFNLSFELWGARNKHLIEYENPLTTSLLFAIRNDINWCEIIDPEEIDLLGWQVPKAFREVKIDSKTDLYSWYQKLRNELESTNKNNEDGTIIGSEGFVWYLKDINNRIHQFKCKPETIETIHWSQGGITKASIWTTIINAYEDNEEVNFETVKDLLLEEFDERGVELKKSLILDLMIKVKKEIDFRNDVLEKYNLIGLNLSTDKAEVMRTLSKYFKREEMKKVYSLLKLKI